MYFQVQDLEVELETMKLTREESLQQAIVVEKERVTQVQWDMDEFRRKCMEMELKLKSEQVKLFIFLLSCPEFYYSWWLLNF